MLGYFPSLRKILGSISIIGKRNSNNEGLHTRNRWPKLGMVAFTSLPVLRRLREENLEDEQRFSEQQSWWEQVLAIHSVWGILGCGLASQP